LSVRDETRGGAGGVAIGDAVGSGTSGSVLHIDASGNLAQANPDFTYLGSGLNLAKTITAVGNFEAVDVDYKISPTSSNSGNFFVGIDNTVQSVALDTNHPGDLYGIYSDLYHNSSVNITTLNGISSYAENASPNSVSTVRAAEVVGKNTGNGAATNVDGIYAGVQSTGGGNISNMRGLIFSGDHSSTGTLTDGYGAYIPTFTKGFGAGTITNMYGVYIGAQSQATNNWNIYSEGASSRNYLQGSLGINVSVPDAQLDVVPANASTVGLQVTLAATPTANALEINANGGVGSGDLLRVSPTGAVTSSQGFTASAAGFSTTTGGNGYNFSGGGYFTSPSNGVFKFSDAADTSFGRLQLGGTTSSFPSIKRSSAAVAFRLADDSADCNITVGATVLSGKVTTYNNVATTGWGVPAIYGTGRSTAQTAAVASVATYTVGAADGSFLISSNVLITTSSAENFTVTCAYTDEGNTARTVTLNFQILAGTIGTAINFANGAVPYEGISIHIRAKASTAITVATTGTFTGATYNVEASITQIA
jgi:hypothetical protein